MSSVVVTADDFGLTRTNVRTITETIDGGAVRRVSVIVNGFAVDEAISSWSARKSQVSLSLHLNLTEGKALANPQDIPSLVRADGTFRYSAINLFIRCIFAGRVIRREISHELALQVECLQRKTNNAKFFIDGHQHVQMIPAVFDAIIEYHKKASFLGVRIVREPFFLPRAFITTFFSLGGVRHFGLNALSRRARRVATQNHLVANDYFIGSLLSGCQAVDAIEAGLLEAKRLKGNYVEIGIHPGHATDEEVVGWRGDQAWHTSYWRERERVVSNDTALTQLMVGYIENSMSQTGSKRLEILRFLIAGGLSTATNLVLLYLFTEFLGIFYILSAIGSYSFATLVSFALQKYWAFSHQSDKRIVGEFMLHIANNILGVVFDLVGLHVLVEYLGVWYLLAQLILLSCIAIWNFFIFRFVIFKKT